MVQGQPLRQSIGGTVRDGRLAIGWSKETLAQRSGLSRGMVGRVERGGVNVTVDTASRLLEALGLVAELSIRRPFITRPRQVDAAHATCVAHVQRRLEAAGWAVRREVEIVHARSHGWIDILAFEPATRTMLVIEVKTEIHDLGRVERTLTWYKRESWAAARRLGWRPQRVRPWLLVLATEANDARLRDNRAAVGQSFPARSMDMLEPAGTGGGVALIDPRSRRREWLIRARIDGRRTSPPYRDYAEFITGRSGRDR